MELLYFLGQDTSINIITSEYGQKLKSPAINVHIKTGGVTVQDVELFLTEDKDEAKEAFNFFNTASVYQ